jgi:hypothetical protein
MDLLYVEEAAHVLGFAGYLRKKLCLFSIAGGHEGKYHGAESCIEGVWD